MVKKEEAKSKKAKSAKGRSASGSKKAATRKSAKGGSGAAIQHDRAQHKGPKHTNHPRNIASATVRNIRIAPQKARLVINMVRGKQVEPALQALQFSPKKGAKIVEKLLRSAISNAVERVSADVDKLWVTGGFVDTGRSLKRLIPRAQGRGDIINKKSSHITIFLGERV